MGTLKGSPFHTQMAPISIAASANLNRGSLPSSTPSLRHTLKPLRCSPLQPQTGNVMLQFGSRLIHSFLWFICVKVDAGIMCEPCNGKGWLVCDFCKGQKTNVKGENKRIYRRCPSCRAVGYVLCSRCKVFKCVTFPNFSDGED